MANLETLKGVSIFIGIADDVLQKIGALCKEQTYDKGDIIIEEDTPGEALHIIRSGKARIAKLEGGYERNIAEVSVGEHVGEMSLIDDLNTSARVIAEEPTECLTLYKDDFELLLNSDDQLHITVLRAINKTLAQRLRRTSEDLMVWKLEFNEDFE